VSRAVEPRRKNEHEEDIHIGDGAGRNSNLLWLQLRGTTAGYIKHRRAIWNANYAYKSG
jgi:hypothetical protein